MNYEPDEVTLQSHCWREPMSDKAYEDFKRQNAEDFHRNLRRERINANFDGIAIIILSFAVGAGFLAAIILVLSR